MLAHCDAAPVNGPQEHCPWGPFHARRGCGIALVSTSIGSMRVIRRYNQRGSIHNPLVKIQPRVPLSVRNRLAAAAQRHGVSEASLAADLLADGLSRLEAWEEEQEEADPERHARVMACKQGTIAG